MAEVGIRLLPLELHPFDQFLLGRNKRHAAGLKLSDAAFDFKAPGLIDLGITACASRNRA